LSKPKEIIVIGAGASGLVAAGTVAETGAKVTLVEKMDKPGRKLLITGKGRCNITNISPLSNHLQQIRINGNYMKTAFYEFFHEDIKNLLEINGVATTKERGNRLFPSSNKASDVVDALVKWNKKSAVNIRINTRAKRLVIKEDRLTGIEIQKGNQQQTLSCDAVIICTGGMSYPATGSNGEGYKLARQAGHSIINPKPSLVPLETDGDPEELQGLSLKNVAVSLWADDKKLASEFGEMLFTHFGVSGPVILTLSREIPALLESKRKIAIKIDLKPALDEGKLKNKFLEAINDSGKKRIENIIRPWLPSLMVPYLLNRAKISADKEGHQVTTKERQRLIYLMKNLSFQVTGHRPFKEAVITSGGVNCREVNFKTMESKLCQNLFFAGEILDIDSNTGGYNLQIAWSTGYLAGKNAVMITN